MYCPNCGNQIDDSAYVCPICGASTTGEIQPEQKKGKNVMAIVGFVLSFFTALVGLIISAVALKRANNELNGDGKGFATAGIIIGAIGTAAYVIGFIIYFIEIGALFSMYGSM